MAEIDGTTTRRRRWRGARRGSGRNLGSRRRRHDLHAATTISHIADLNERHAATMLRMAFALVFVWFGALKLVGSSPVENLIAATLPFVDPEISVPLIGLAEVAIGAAVALGRVPRLTLLLLTGHLAGTFLAFVTASEFLIRNGNPLQLTADGEFVVKNVILISAALFLIGWYSNRDAAPDPS